MAHKMTDEEIIKLKKQSDEILSFIKDAFCVDGKVEHDLKKRTFTSTIKCTDKKRGIFYIGMK